MGINVNRSMGTDRLAGAFFIAAGLIFLLLGRDFGFGSMHRIGPGFFPIILSCLLILLGGAILAKSLISDETFVMPRLGPFVRVIAAIAIFAGLTQPVGTYVILPIVVVLAASASVHFRWKSALVLAAGITICSDLIFRMALGLPLYAIGSWFGG